jgi:hypothetical protein
MVRPEGVEPPTYWFVASCSIQLSYGRTSHRCNKISISCLDPEDQAQQRISVENSPETQNVATFGCPILGQLYRAGWGIERSSTAFSRSI